MVTRILREMFRFNEFNDPPTGSTTATVTTPAHQAVSTAVAEAGTVLLKNTGGTLPLSPDNGGTVAVIGPAASAAPTDTGGGSAYVTSTFNVTPLQGLQAAAGTGTTVQYTQGLPTDTSLSAIPSADLTPAYTATGYGGTYTGTLTAPETGTYVLGFSNPGSYTVTNLYLNGKEILADPGTPPVSTYSVGVNLVAGQTYTLQLSGGGPSANLSWAMPSDLAPGIAQAVAAAKSAKTAVVVVSDDTESEAADRASLNLPSAQNELISAVAAANRHTVVVIDAGAPVVMPWLSQVASVVDAWYPGESNGTALAAVLFGQVDPGGHLPVTFPTDLSQVPASSPSEFPGTGGQVLYSEGIDVGYRYYDANNETPLFPFGYGLSYTNFAFSQLHVTPQTVQNGSSDPGATSCGCNGQSDSLVTVSARVTNTGQVAGSDAAQLYLGDPAAAGEPEGDPAARPVHDSPLHAERPRPVLLGRRGQRLGGARRAVPGLRRRLLGPGQPAFARRLYRRAQPRRPVCDAPGAGCHRSRVHGHGHRDRGKRRRLRDAAGRVHRERPRRLDGHSRWPASPLRGSAPDCHRQFPRQRAREREGPYGEAHRQGDLPIRAGRRQRRPGRGVHDGRRPVRVPRGRL
jgi:beta-glucosidase